MNIKIGTEVEFQETMTRRMLRGTVAKCRDGQVEIHTPDGRITSRLAARVKPIPTLVCASARIMPPPAPTDIQSLFESVRDVVVMVARGHTASAIVSGPGGLGKTHTVTETLDGIGLRRGVDYQMVKGFT